MNLLRGVNLYLIGMMGAGKTTVGRWLAQELEYRFFDTDDIIAQTANRSIPEIFAQDGEETFRQLETEVLAQLSPYKNLTVATGGGIVLRQMNWSYLHHGLTVWLDVPVAELYTRLQGDTTRPLLQDPDPQAKLETLLSQREKLYAQADVRVRVNRGETPEVIGRRVLEEIQKVIKPEGSDNGGIQIPEDSPN